MDSSATKARAPRRADVGKSLDARAAPLIGLDLVEPERIKATIDRTPRLASRLFHPRELAYCERQAEPQQHLAARFSAKEAVTKALGINGFEPLDVEVVDGGADCGLRLHGEAAKAAEELKVVVTVSLTHVAGVAAAVALARPIA
jgi:holo-[acyl-carrier protein] synthase